MGWVLSNASICVTQTLSRQRSLPRNIFVFKISCRISQREFFLFTGLCLNGKKIEGQDWLFGSAIDKKYVLYIKSTLANWNRYHLKDILTRMFLLLDSKASGIWLELHFPPKGKAALIFLHAPQVSKIIYLQRHWPPEV